MQRDFTAIRPNEKWVADLTYIRTWNGFVYLAFILDCYSRRIVGWQLATHMRAELVLDALEMANGLRRPSRRPDRALGSRLAIHELDLHRPARRARDRPVDRLRGDAYDNAMAEAWVATFKNELVDGRRFPSFEHVEHETLDWIGFYNDERLHEALGDLPPAEYEAHRLSIKTDNSPIVAAT